MSSIALFNSKRKPLFLVIKHTSIFLMSFPLFLSRLFLHYFFSPFLFRFALTRSALMIFILFNDHFLFSKTPSLEI